MRWKKPLQTPLWVECGREGMLSNLELVVVQKVELSYTSIVLLALQCLGEPWHN